MLKELLLIEKSNYKIENVSTENKYVFEGIFTEFDSQNRNGRIYTKKEFLPHFEALKKLVEQGKCLGELDHPKQFETSLKNVSHIVEKVWLDEENNRVMGRIKLLDTDMGKQAKALVDAGVPLHISSRAAGSVTENKTVKIHKLFTYDLVDTPGFENAVMNCVNESYGFSSEVNENSNFVIYEVQTSNKSKNETVLNSKTNNNNMNISENDFNKYTDYTKSEISAIKSELAQLKVIQEGIIKQNDEMVDEFNNVDLSVYEGLVKRIESLEKLNEGLTQNTNQVDLTDINNKLDAIMKWSEEVTETVTGIESWSEEVTETVSALENWSDEATQNIRGIKSWSQEVTETVSALENWSDEATKTVSALENWSDEATKTVSALENWSDEATKTVSALEESKKETLVNVGKVEESVDFDTYKNLILEKIENIVTEQQKVTSLNENANNAVNENSNETPLWLENIPSKFKSTWKSLSESEKSKIQKRADMRDFKSSTAIREFWNTQFSQTNLIKEEQSINKGNLNENLNVDRRQAIIENYRKNFG